jgi:hypothetical protein
MPKTSIPLRTVPSHVNARAHFALDPSVLLPAAGGTLFAGMPAFRVPLDGYEMQLRRWELEAVAAGLGTFDASAEGNLATLAEALSRLPSADRAPTWELAVRRYGHGKPLAQAAGEIGLDALHAEDLLAAFNAALLAVPPPERR